MDKIKPYMYYFLIGVISMLSLLFLPFIGSKIGLGWEIPNTAVGWIVWITTKLIVASLNVLIFHCFMMQAKLNISENDNFKKANKILESTEKKEKEPRSPIEWNRQQYTRKGVIVFIFTSLSTIALTQALFTFDWISMLTYLFTIIMGLIFGIMQMKNAENYWTTEYYEYALMQEGKNDKDRR